MRFRIRLRKFWFHLQTMLGISTMGFFIPYRYAAQVPKTQPKYKQLDAVFAGKRANFSKLCNSLDAYSDAFSDFGPVPAPRWDQDWFPRLDGAAAYGIVRKYKPKTIIEVGSGHSTRFMAQAIKDEWLDCQQIAIDPNPRATIKQLPVDWREGILEQEHIEMFANLQAGDIAFFDSSHILMPGTDVDMILNRIFPVLKSGVLIHIHDVFLPAPYPDAWLWRGYNEQNALGPMIAGGICDLVFASSYVAATMQDEIAMTCLKDIPIKQGAFETSLWLQKR